MPLSMRNLSCFFLQESTTASLLACLYVQAPSHYRLYGSGMLFWKKRRWAVHWALPFPQYSLLSPVARFPAALALPHGKTTTRRYIL